MQWDYGKFILKQLEYSPSFSTSDSHWLGCASWTICSQKTRVRSLIVNKIACKSTCVPQIANNRKNWILVMRNYPLKDYKHKLRYVCRPSLSHEICCHSHRASFRLHVGNHVDWSFHTVGILLFEKKDHIFFRHMRGHLCLSLDIHIFLHSHF